MGDKMKKEIDQKITPDNILKTCINDAVKVIQAFETQTKILHLYQLDLFQETEQSKLKYLEIYNRSLEILLKMPEPQKSFSKPLKDLFLKLFEKLKQVILTNKMVLEATKKTKENLMNIYKNYIEEEFKRKSYGFKGNIPKSFPATTFFESI